MTTSMLEQTIGSGQAATLKVLLLEHMVEDAELILQEFKEAGFPVEFRVARSRDDFLRELRDHEFHAVFSEYRLPDWTGLDAFKELRRMGKDIPFLLVTGTMSDEAAVDCIKQGMSDYVLKEHLSRLKDALKRALCEKALWDENAKARKALEASEARNRDLVENSVYGICRISPQGGFLDANRALSLILGCASVQELEGLNLVNNIFRFPEQFAQFTASCREHGQVHGAEAEWRRKDGGIVSVRLHLRQLSIPNQDEAIELIAEDVTELRALEHQLRQSQKFEAIGQLAGGIAHDFNNVVGAILGWAELGCEQSKELPKIAERFSRIREQGERAAALTRELLAFARRQVLQPRAVDLNAVVGGLVSFLDKVITKDIELKVVAGALDSVKADPTQIEQVLMNLCLNARDAMPNGGRLVIETEMADLDDAYCRFYPHVAPGRHAVISVSDTGTGMDAETREHIFEPFFTTKKRGKGNNGMGLATVYGIIKQHSGFIHVYSEPSHGSLFRVYLPSMSGAAATGSEIVPPVQIAADFRGSETILLAEDHESIREMARQFLLSLGYRVLSACDGEGALQLCEKEQPALAILDVVMPNLGGRATAVKLSALFPDLPILLTSGYSPNSNGDMPQNPWERYLQKPYSPRTLGRIVREMLDQKKDSIQPA